MVLNGELFWGGDRIDMLIERIRNPKALRPHSVAATASRCETHRPRNHGNGYAAASGCQHPVRSRIGRNAARFEASSAANLSRSCCRHFT